MKEFTLKKYSFDNFLGIVGDAGHPPLAEIRKRIDVDEDMPRLIQACGIKDGCCAIDVGAFIGDTALPLLRAGAKVIAFEPFLDAYTAMLYNTANKDIKAFNQPVGNGEWVKFIYECPGPNFGMRRVVPVLETTNEAVQTVRLDDYCYGKSAQPILRNNDIKLIKLDCEGSEIPAIEGARRLIAEDKPFLYVEMYEEGLRQRGYTPKDLTDCLDSIGYTYEMWGSPPRWDWFCRPKP
jgi:FkbM family methyltransferase